MKTERLTVKEHIDLINKYQNDGKFHPLTCGNNSNHKVLKAVEKDGNVILICEDCNYVQTYIPF